MQPETESWSPTLEAKLRELLSRRLPPSWEVDFTSINGDPQPRHVALKNLNAIVTFVTFIASSLTPRELQQWFGNPQVLTPLRNSWQNLLMVSPYLSPRVQEMLRDMGISYVDLTGNVYLAAQNPPIFIHTVGATQAPKSPHKRRFSMRGLKTGIIIRALSSITTPCTLTELANAVRTDLSYVAQVVGRLEEEGYVTREPYGPITRVDWQALLRARAEAQPLLKRSGIARFVAPSGPERLISDLENGDSSNVVLTGSFVARRLAPVAAPVIAAAYVPDTAQFADEHNLLPTDRQSFDVLLIQPKSSAPVLGADIDAGYSVAHVTQVALDCLGGIGRMQSEGEALLEWMQANQAVWRGHSATIQAWRDPWKR